MTRRHEEWAQAKLIGDLDFAFTFS